MFAAGPPCPGSGRRRHGRAISTTANGYSNGALYSSGTSGVGTATITAGSNDRIFHLDLQHPMNPSPDFGVQVPAGDLTLSWTNEAPTTGTDVWVDVWFGTAPGSMTKVASAQQNLTSFLVNLPGANNSTSIDRTHTTPTSKNSGSSENYHWVVYTVMKHAMDLIYTAENLGLADSLFSVAVPETSGTVSGVNFAITPDGTSNQVVATIPIAEAISGKLFARLIAEPAP